MPAKTPPALVRKVRTLRGEGLRQSEIIEQTGLSRSTVGRICRDADRDQAIEASPAASLSENEVAALRVLIKAYIRSGTCPKCGERYICVEDQVKVTCGGCGRQLTFRG